MKWPNNLKKVSLGITERRGELLCLVFVEALVERDQASEENFVNLLRVAVTRWANETQHGRDILDENRDHVTIQDLVAARNCVEFKKILEEGGVHEFQLLVKNTAPAKILSPSLSLIV